MTTEYGQRLRAARKHAKLTQDQLSKKTGIPQSTISTAERDGHGSGETPVYADVCGVNALWLANGSGEMLTQPSAIQEEAPALLMSPLAAAVAVLSGYLLGMEATTRRRAGRLLADLASEPESHAQITEMLEAAIRSGKDESPTAPGVTELTKILRAHAPGLKVEPGAQRKKES